MRIETTFLERHDGSLLVSRQRVDVRRLFRLTSGDHSLVVVRITVYLIRKKAQAGELAASGDWSSPEAPGSNFCAYLGCVAATTGANAHADEAEPEERQ